MFLAPPRGSQPIMLFSYTMESGAERSDVQPRLYLGFDSQFSSVAARFGQVNNLSVLLPIENNATYLLRFLRNYISRAFRNVPGTQEVLYKVCLLLLWIKKALFN